MYRILPDGASDLVWQLRDDAPFDLAFETDGSVLVATGNNGKIYRLSGDPMQPTLVARALVQQVTTLLADRTGRCCSRRRTRERCCGSRQRAPLEAPTPLTCATHRRWQPGARSSGRARCPPAHARDFHAVGEHADSGRDVERLEQRLLRCGGQPDRQPSGAIPAVAGGADGHPRSGADPHLGDRGLPAAQQPAARHVDHDSSAWAPSSSVPSPPAIPRSRGSRATRQIGAPRRRTRATPGSAPALGRRAYQRGLLTFVWRAEDENRDELSYDVLYRREGETAWKPLKRGLTDAILVWDTTSVPNGRYVVQVVVSDLPSNAAGSALTASTESTTFDIDNMPPIITVTGVRREGTRHGRRVRRAGHGLSRAEDRVFARWRPLAGDLPEGRHRRFARASSSSCGSKGMRRPAGSSSAPPTR